MLQFKRVVTIFLLNAVLIFVFFIVFTLILMLLGGGDPRGGGFLIGISPLFILGIIGVFIAILGGIPNAAAVQIQWENLASSDGSLVKRVCVFSAVLASLAAIMASIGGSEHRSPYFLPVVAILLFFVFASSNLLTVLIAKKLFPLEEPSSVS